MLVDALRVPCARPEDDQVSISMSNIGLFDRKSGDAFNEACPTSLTRICPQRNLRCDGREGLWDGEYSNGEVQENDGGGRRGFVG